MEFKDQFELGKSIEETWNYLSDPKKFASCIPGYVEESIEILDERNFKLKVTQTIARIPATFEMDVQILELEAPNLLVAKIHGRDPFLGSNLDAQSTLELSQVQENVTGISYSMTMNVTGKVATFGHPVIKAKGKKFSQEFVTTLKSEIA